jgi:hypothetical protein
MGMVRFDHVGVVVDDLHSVADSSIHKVGAIISFLPPVVLRCATQRDAVADIVTAGMTKERG